MSSIYSQIYPRILFYRSRSRSITSTLSLDTSAYVYFRADTKEPIDNGESQSSSQSDELPPLTTTTERRLMAKVDWHILPAICILYLLAFLDR